MFFLQPNCPEMSGVSSIPRPACPNRLCPVPQSISRVAGSDSAREAVLSQAS